mgnify:CR=1 FL=1
MIVCKICNYTAEKTLQAHLNHTHKMKVKDYSDLYPGAIIFTEAIRESSRVSNKNRDQSYRKKLSENTLRLYQDPEWTKKHNEALKKAQSTPEAKENHSIGANKYYTNQTSDQKKKQKNACKRSWTDPISRNNRIKGLQKAHRSEEGRKNHSEATKKYLAIPGNQEKRNKALKKTWAKPENRKKLEKIIQMGLKAASTPEARAANKLAQQNPELRKIKSIRARKNLSHLLKNRIKYSGLNAFLKDKMAENNLFPKKEFPIGPYCVDFCFPHKKIVIEADGDFWHANPEFMKEKNRTELHPIQKKMVHLDKSKNTYLKNQDWVVLRFWERDIYKKTELCIKKIKDTLQGVVLI